MMDDDLDRILSGDDSIVPSSGFAGSVMEAVRREAAVPPALPFPWERALPGLVAGIVTLGSLVVASLSASSADLSPVPVPEVLVASAKWAIATGAHWVTLALLVSYLAVKFSLRLAGRP